MDTATTEFLFCCDFFAETEVFRELFHPIIAVVEAEFTSMMHVPPIRTTNVRGLLQDMHDVIALLLMIKINHEHHRIMTRRRVPCLDDYLDRINLILWPKFKAVFDAQLESIKRGNEKILFTNTPSVHIVARRFASTVSALLVLTAGYEEDEEGAFNVSGFDHMLERLRTAFCGLLSRISRLFKDRRYPSELIEIEVHARSSTVFLVANYSHVVSTLKECSAMHIQPASPSSSSTPLVSMGKMGALAIKEYEVLS